MSRIGLTAPRMLEACVTQTSFVFAPISGSRSARSSVRVCLSSGQNRTTTPLARSLSQGPILDSWSLTVTTISSPGASWLSMARARFCKSTVVEPPKTISSGRLALTRCMAAVRAS